MDEQRLQRGPNSGPRTPDWGPPPARVSALPGPGAPSWSPPPAGPNTAQAPIGYARLDTSQQPPPPMPGATPMPGRPPTKPPAGPPARWLLGPILATAGLAEIALRSNWTSVAAALATIVAGGLIITGQDRRRPSVLVPVGLAIATMVLAVFRTSLWVVGPCMIVAGVGLIIASQGKLHSRDGLLTMAGNLLSDMIEGPRWITGPYRKRTTANKVERFSLRGLLLVVATVAPITALLASGDAVFGQLLLLAGSGSLLGHAVLALLLVPVVVGLTLSARRPTGLGNPAIQTAGPRPDGTTAGNGSPTGNGSTSGDGPLSMVEATMVLGAVAAVMGLWAATQILVALGGADRLLATADLTAAENARSGFFQMAAVVAFLTVVIAALSRFTARSSASDHLRFLGLTVIVGVETLALVWSSYSRLSLYIDGFGNTMLRTSVAWFLAWLALAMVLLICSIHLSGPGRSGGTRPSLTARGSAFVLAGLWVVAFAAYNPEAAVAQSNLERDEAPVSLDQRYLTDELGLDAVPTVVDGLEDLDADTAQSLRERLCRVEPPTGSYGFLGWNRSADRAQQALLSLNCP